MAEHGYDPIYGARPLRRLMQQQIDDQLANLLLAGRVTNGSAVLVDVAADGTGLSVSSGGEILSTSLGDIDSELEGLG